MNPARSTSGGESRRRPPGSLLPAATGLGILVLWYGLRYGLGLAHYYLPVPHEVLLAAWEERATLFAATTETTLGAIIGFSMAAVGGLLLALLLGLATPLRRAFSPWITALQMTPVIVLAPIFLLWVGPGLPSVVLITFMISFFPVVANTLHGLLSTDPHAEELFCLYGANRWQTLWQLRLPNALPAYLTGLRIASTLAVIGTLTGEFLAGSAGSGDRTGGLGFMVMVYRSQVKMAESFATAGVACLVGFLFVGAVGALRWQLLHRWHPSHQNDSAS